MRVLVASLLLLTCPLPAHADCSGGSLPTGQPCGAIDYVGCCKAGVVQFCEGGELCTLPCDKIPQCGWNGDKGIYDCETAGGADPGLEFPMACPASTSGQCQGVDYSGCCAGSWVYWCDGQQIQGVDCGANQEYTSCGTNAAAAVADCVLPGGAPFKECSFEPGGVEVPDPPVGDVVAADGHGVLADVQLSTDGLSVPDIEAPSTCSELAPRYEETQGDCEMLGAVFLVKQDGCAALLVGLAPEAGEHPGAKVTKTGLAFSFGQGGLDYHCTGAFAGESLNGHCFWGNGGECAFGYRAVTVALPDPVPQESSGSGGCSAAGAAGARPGWLLFSLIWLILRGLRCGVQRRTV